MQTRHFRCTECGACCNRAPEVLLSEAAPLADQFIFRLMFRLYRFPKNASARALAGPADKNALLEQRRQIERFAARKNTAKIKSGGKAANCSEYLVISALPFDVPPGRCAGLRDGRCGIYERRPLSCRTVPLHYSRAEALAGHDFDEFVRRPGYRCATDPDCEVILDGGRIVHPGMVEARARAVALAASDQAWNAAILQRMTSNADELPSLKQIQDNAALGAMTTSMRVAWQIARDSGLIEAASYRVAIQNQLRQIEREVVIARASRSDLDTLARMQVEYRYHAFQGLGRNAS